MRRLYNLCWLRALLALGCFAISIGSFGTTARANGFFERLFGMFSAPKSRHTLPPPQSPVVPQPSQSPYPSSPVPYEPRAGEEGALPRSSAGQYRTVCVRLCDGYYFPISSNVSAYRFGRDANICRSRCGAETRLFSMPASAPRIENARDQNGMSYEKLRAAFLYRKKIVAGCSCRAEPWSPSERARHASYAEEQQRQIAERERQAAERRAVANGVPADAARDLFGQQVAEVLPAAPDKNWREAEPAPMRVAMSAPLLGVADANPGSAWTVTTQPDTIQPLVTRPVRQVFELERPVPAAPVTSRPAHPTTSNNAWLSRLRGTDPRTSLLPDGP